MQPVFLKNMEMVSNAPESHSPELMGDDESRSFRFSVKYGECKMLLSTTSIAERSMWVRKLEEARKHCLLTERATLQRQRSSNELISIVNHIISI